jgi:hypothetical protein
MAKLFLVGNEVPHGVTPTHTVRTSDIQNVKDLRDHVNNRIAPVTVKDLTKAGLVKPVEGSSNEVVDWYD